jgi:hypothetical protein
MKTSACADTASTTNADSRQRCRVRRRTTAATTISVMIVIVWPHLAEHHGHVVQQTRTFVGKVAIDLVLGGDRPAAFEQLGEQQAQPHHHRVENGEGGGDPDGNACDLASVDAGCGH